MRLKERRNIDISPAYKLIANHDYAVADGGVGGGGDMLPVLRNEAIGDTGSGKAVRLNGATPATSPGPAKTQRLLSLDVFRGITVALMIFVDDLGSLMPEISHSPWDGVKLADCVMPFFLFIVGVSLTLAYKRVPNRLAATKKAMLRVVKLFSLGLFLQGGFFHGLHDLTYGVDLSTIRLMGVLQRISVAYSLVAICEIWLRGDDGSVVDSGYTLLCRYRYQMLVGATLTVTYMCFLYGFYVPDWEYEINVAGSSKSYSVKCGVRGDTGPACNTVAMVDRKILGLEHLYRKPVYLRTKQCSINSPQSGPLPSDAPPWCQAPFDPEGLLSSLMATVTCLIGLQFGHVIIHFQDHMDRIFRWMAPSLCLLTVAFSLEFFGLRMNKPLYTLSYTFFTAGAAGLLFSGIYILVDVFGFRGPMFLLEWMGRHALMIYVLVACNVVFIFIHGFYWKDPKNNILSLVGIGG